MGKLIQIENEAGDRLYPAIHGDSIPADAVTTEKVKDNSVTEPKLSTELDRKITGSKTVTDTLLRAFAEAKGDPYYLQDAFVRANLIPIPFEDAEVKRILVENYDTDGDGELSYDEVNIEFPQYSILPSTFNIMFTNNNDIRSFNELRFFDKVLNFGQYTFYGCENLESVELPEGVKELFQSNFYNCYKLKYIYLPDSITVIGNYNFYNCYELELDKFPDNLTTIGTRCFLNCKNLNHSKLPDGVTSIGDEAFGGCSSLALTELPSGLKGELCYYCFSGTKVSFTKIPDGVTKLGDAVFKGCPNITSMELPSGITSIGVMCFYDSGLKTLIMDGSTPPNLSGTSLFSTLKTIYVPDDAVDAYKAATEWNNYADIIKPVSEKPAS